MKCILEVLSDSQNAFRSSCRALAPVVVASGGDVDRYGGHIILTRAAAAPAPKAILQWLEISCLGNELQLGEYALHFHKVGDLSESLVENCRIHDGPNKALVVHDSSNLEATGNVACDMQGHSFYMEESPATPGLVTDCLFQGNPGLLTRAADDASIATSDDQPATLLPLGQSAVCFDAEMRGYRWTPNAGEGFVNIEIEDLTAGPVALATWERYDYTISTSVPIVSHTMTDPSTSSAHDFTTNAPFLNNPFRNMYFLRFENLSQSTPLPSDVLASIFSAPVGASLYVGIPTDSTLANLTVRDGDGNVVPATPVGDLSSQTSSAWSYLESPLPMTNPNGSFGVLIKFVIEPLQSVPNDVTAILDDTTQGLTLETRYTGKAAVFEIDG